MKNTFKKIVRVALIIILSFQLISCTQTIKETTIKKETNENNQLLKSQEEPAIEELNKEGVDVVLNDYDKKKLDLFFSNFSEVDLNPFAKDNISESTLIYFGIRHNYINNFNTRIEIKDTDGYINVSYVEESVKKYFDTTIKQHQSVDDYIYENDKYKIILADGEMCEYSEVERLVDNKDGTYTAYVVNYTGEDEKEKVGRIKALIKKINYKGKDTYALLEYLEI